MHPIERRPIEIPAAGRQALLELLQLRIDLLQVALGEDFSLAQKLCQVMRADRVRQCLIAEDQRNQIAGVMVPGAGFRFLECPVQSDSGTSPQAI